MKRNQIIVVIAILVLLIVTNFLTVRFFHKKNDKPAKENTTEKTETEKKED